MQWLLFLHKKRILLIKLQQYESFIYKSLGETYVDLHKFFCQVANKTYQGKYKMVLQQRFVHRNDCNPLLHRHFLQLVVGIDGIHEQLWEIQAIKETDNEYLKYKLFLILFYPDFFMLYKND